MQPTTAALQRFDSARDGWIAPGHAEKALIDGALAMAWTCIDLATHAAVRGRLLTPH